MPYHMPAEKLVDAPTSLAFGMPPIVGLDMYAPNNGAGSKRWSSLQPTKKPSENPKLCVVPSCCLYATAQEMVKLTVQSFSEPQSSEPSKVGVMPYVGTGL